MNKQLEKIIFDVLEPDVQRKQIVPGAKFKSLGADSLDMLDIVQQVEQEFGIEVSNKDFYALQTVGQIAGYIPDHSFVAISLWK